MHKGDAGENTWRAERREVFSAITQKVTVELDPAVGGRPARGRVCGMVGPALLASLRLPLLSSAARSLLGILLLLKKGPHLKAWKGSSWKGAGKLQAQISEVR